MFPEKFNKPTDFIYNAHHGAGMSFFIENARRANAAPDAIYIGAVFLNDYVDSHGKVNWTKVKQAAEPNSSWNEFLDLMMRLPCKALIVGGSSRVWGVGEDYDDVAKAFVLMARAKGIPTVYGTRAWLRMPLVKEKKKGKIVTWHVAKSDHSARILMYFLKAAVVMAKALNAPKGKWGEDIVAWSPTKA